MNRDPKSFFEKAKNHVTKYQHAATLYKRDDETLLDTYNTYIDQVEGYINYAKDLNNLHMQEFVRLSKSGHMTEEVASAINQFSQENMTAIRALSDQIEKYDKIATKVHGNTDFEITNDMDRMISAGLASDVGDAEPKVGLKGKVAGSVADRANTGMGILNLVIKGIKLIKLKKISLRT